MDRDVSRGNNNKAEARDNKARAGSKAARLRAVPLEAPAQDSVMEPTAEAITTRILAADVSAACTTILIQAITHPAGALQYSPIALPFRPSALTMTACGT
jgi:hypothetical protein